MKRDEKTHFGKLLSGAAELYNKKLSQELLEIYWRALEQYSLADIAQALNLHVLNPDNGQFMPKPADIVRCVHGDTRVQALKAWSKVTAAIKSVGSYESIVFDDSIIHVVIQEMDGWIELCQSKQDKLPFVANEFQKRYAAHSVHKPALYPNKFVGVFEHQNAQRTNCSDEPQFFGDSTLAKLVYANGINLNTMKPTKNTKLILLHFCRHIEEKRRL